MFTGIVECTGVVKRCETVGAAASLVVASDRFKMDGVSIGDSIAVNGVCLTVVGFSGNSLDFDVSPETLKLVTGFVVGDVVNLERAMTLNSLIGGHLVSGHVDGTGMIEVVDEKDGNWEITVTVPSALNRYLVKKGSITVNGVSLTVNEDKKDKVLINLVPHTINMTNLKLITPGSSVNLEVDLLARYAEKLLTNSDSL
ncbi:MAG: riboflavin synthase [Proteobacteria bacterium]|nr:riboflavin synthase [Pseudomonadota bacterium]MDA1011998.1 riboflavin synthase [Pseudomonadota bacterium]